MQKNMHKFSPEMAFELGAAVPVANHTLLRARHVLHEAGLAERAGAAEDVLNRAIVRCEESGAVVGGFQQPLRVGRLVVDDFALGVEDAREEIGLLFPGSSLHRNTVQQVRLHVTGTCCLFSRTGVSEKTCARKF
jgi:hypothetical protein